jgi:hypothetical protein
MQMPRIGPTVRGRTTDDLATDLGGHRELRPRSSYASTATPSASVTVNWTSSARAANVCDVPIGVLLRVAIGWVNAAGPAVLVGAPPALAPEDAPALISQGCTSEP